MASAITDSLTTLPSNYQPAYDPALVSPSVSAAVTLSTSMQQAAITPHQSNEQHSLASLKSLKSSMTSKFEAPPLTGAAALEDIRLEQERQRHKARDQNQSPNCNTTHNSVGTTSAISMNPAASAKAALLGTSLDFGTSKPNEAPIPMPAPMALKDAANNDNVPRTMQLNIPDPSAGQAAPPDDKTSVNGLAVEAHLHTPQPTTATIPRQNDGMIEDSATADQSPDEAQMRTPIVGQPSGALSRSSLSVSSSKKHKCPYCETEFTRHHNLKSHLLTHSQEKPYECATCQAKFRRLHDLKRHTKLHTGERPHTCSKCGRRFARGDALARHNKGPGGCANGRRGSFGDEDGDGGDDSMEGVVYQDDHGSDSREEDEGNSRKRRRSEPNASERRADLQAPQGTGGNSYRISSSTYPGTAATANMTGNYSGNSTMITSPPETSVYPPPPNGASSYSSQYNGPQSVYGRGHITDSPRHLSPEADASRFPMSEAASLRGRSASLTSHYQHQQQYRPGSMGTPSLPLPSLSSHSGPQLPSLLGLASESRNNHFASSSPAGVNSSLPPYTSLPPVDNASISSGQRSSSSSMREILKGANMPEHVEFMEYVRSLEAKVSRLETEVSLLREHQPQHSTQGLPSQLPQPPAPR